MQLIVYRILAIVPNDVPLTVLSPLVNAADVDDWFYAIAW